MTIVAMLLCICRLLQPRDEPSGAKPDPDPDAGHLASLRGLLQWPLRNTPSWGISIEGVDFFIEDGELDLKMVREGGGGHGNSRRFLLFLSSVHYPV